MYITEQQALVMDETLLPASRQLHARCRTVCQLPQLPAHLQMTAFVELSCIALFCRYLLTLVPKQPPTYAPYLLLNPAARQNTRVFRHSQTNPGSCSSITNFLPGNGPVAVGTRQLRLQAC